MPFQDATRSIVQSFCNCFFHILLSLCFYTSLNAVANTPASNIPAGWAAHKISMGGVINGGEEAYYLQRRPVDAVFTYAGLDGAGDRQTIITRDSKIDRVVTEIRAIEANINNSLMLTVVFYSVDGSSGTDSLQMDLTNNADSHYLRTHYINLISLLRQLESYRSSERPVPATLLLNPDFLGELHKQCQEYYCPVALDLSVPVGAALSEAFDFLNLDKSIIPAELLAADVGIPTYVRSLNWLVNYFGPNIPFGWQDNVWAGDTTGHGWIHLAANKDSSQVAKHVESETNFLLSMNVYGNNNSMFNPDFIAFDKWERDVFDAGMAGAGVHNGYLYNADDLAVFINYVKGISQQLNNMPVMLWQIPGGHLQVNGDIDSRVNHASTEADYFLGNPAVSANLDGVLSFIVDTPMPNSDIYQRRLATVKDYLTCPAQEPNCWQTGHLNALADANVFAILWGGGSTTSVAGLSPALDDNGWLFERIYALGLNNGEGSEAPLNIFANSSTSSTASSAASCAPWSELATYQAGSCVTFNGEKFQAQWWNQGASPATESGADGSGKVWRHLANESSSTSSSASSVTSNAASTSSASSEITSSDLSSTSSNSSAASVSISSAASLSNSSAASLASEASVSSSSARSSAIASSANNNLSANSSSAVMHMSSSSIVSSATHSASGSSENHAGASSGNHAGASSENQTNASAISSSTSSINSSASSTTSITHNSSSDATSSAPASSTNTPANASSAGGGSASGLLLILLLSLGIMGRNNKIRN